MSGRTGGHEESSEYVSPAFIERIYRMELKTDQLTEKMLALAPMTGTVAKFEATMDRLEDSMRRALDRLESVSKRVDETQSKLNETVTEIAVIQTKLGTETDKLEKLEKEVRESGKFWSRWGVNIVIGALVAAVTSFILRR